MAPRLQAFERRGCKMRNGQQVGLQRLLIVDDVPSVRSSMVAVLVQIGFSVRSADNGCSALAEIGREAPDIVISDLNMPRMSGFEFLRVVRRHFPSIHLVAMSGAFSGDEVPSGLTADAFYPKGSGARCLLKIIERFNQPRPLPKQHKTAPALICILQNGYDVTGEPCVSIDCPDCHRSFQEQVGGLLSLIREAHCTSCRNTVYYAIVEPVDLTPPSPCQRVSRVTESNGRPQLHSKSAQSASQQQSMQTPYQRLPASKCEAVCGSLLSGSLLRVCSSFLRALRMSLCPPESKTR